MSVSELLQTDELGRPAFGDWVACVGQHMLPGLQITPLRDGPSFLKRFDFAGARMWRAASSAQKVMRSRPSPRGRFLPVAILQLAGRTLVTQAHGACTLNAGSFAYVDAAKPLMLEQFEDFEQIYVQFPGSAFAPASFAPAVAATMSGSSTVDRMFFDYVTSLWQAAPCLHPLQYGSALTALLSLSNLTTAFRNGIDQAPPSVRVDRAIEFIENRLGEEGLTAGAVAENQGISRRHLDDLFSRRGHSVESWIWERRLLRAADRLDAHAVRNVTLIEIAFDLGFKSPSHFSRMFSRRFGMSPKLYRQRSRQTLT